MGGDQVWPSSVLFVIPAEHAESSFARSGGSWYIVPLVYAPQQGSAGGVVRGCDRVGAQRLDSRSAVSIYVCDIAGASTLANFKRFFSPY